jgi:hypothetical protein
MSILQAWLLAVHSSGDLCSVTHLSPQVTVLEQKNKALL